MKKGLYIFLTYLVVVSLLAAGISMSRFETTMTGNGVAVVGRAVIDYVPVSATLNGQPIDAGSGGINISDLTAGSEMIYEFDINNYKGESINEVLLKYKISVGFDPEPQTIPLTCTLTPGGAYQSAGDDGWVLLGFAEQETHSYMLTIQWDEADTDPDFLNQQQMLKLIIDAEQTMN